MADCYANSVVKIRVNAVAVVLVLLLMGCSVTVTNELDSSQQGAAATSSLKPGEAGYPRTDAKGVAQVFVPAGCFMMGSDPAKDSNATQFEQPAHEVCLTHAFWLDIYEVTNAAYQEFIDDGGYTQSQYWSKAGWTWLQTTKFKIPINYKRLTDLDQPRAGISWYEADAYARWRGGRLPTEAEWEYAARGAHGAIFPWGDQSDRSRATADFDYDYSVRDDSKDNKQNGRTSPVGSFPGGISWVGAYDMAGNVWEWLADWFDPNYYNQGVKNDPTGPADELTDPNWGHRRSIRGGGWNGDPQALRSAFRAGDFPEFGDDNKGVRVAGDFAP